MRPWSQEDRGAFAALARDPRVMLHIGDGSTWGPERIAEVFDRQLAHWDEHGFGWRAALLADTSEWAGFVGLNHVGPEATEIPGDEVEIGWWLRPDLWRCGLATEGALALRDEAFTGAGLERIIGRFHPVNVASGRIMQRLRMTHERDATGRHGDLVRIYALSKEAWANEA